jgi:folate-binding protein YgfZ
MAGMAMLGSTMPSDEVVLLASGKAFADLSFWRKVAVSGRDAFDWLNDLISADISGLSPGKARHSLLLSPTGRIRAEFTVAVPGGTLLLVQDPDQPRSIGDLLAPYVLSSYIELEDRTNDYALFAFPGHGEPPDIPGTAPSAPSCLGEGSDLLALDEDHDMLVSAMSREYTAVGAETAEAWRVVAGIPRFGVDAFEEDLPEEGGFAGAVSFDKGCYLGQESVARIRNLGHPRRLVVALRSGGPALSAGDPLLVNGDEAGEITSVAVVEGESHALARVRWDRRAGPFTDRTGAALHPRATLAP